MIRAHKNAVLDRMRANPELADCTFEGVVESRPHRYATVFFDSGIRDTDRLTGSATMAAFTFIVHSVGTSADQAQFIAEAVLEQLIDWTPTVDGYACQRLRQTATVPVQRDRDGLPPVFFCVDEFTFVTQTLN